MITVTKTYNIRVVCEYEFRADSLEEARRQAAERVIDERALLSFDIINL